MWVQTEALHAVGSIGCSAVRGGEVALAGRAVALILAAVALTAEPGAVHGKTPSIDAHPSYARVNLVRSVAASNLIRLLSSPRNRPSLGPRA